jgi:hypothetical protein
MEEDLRGRLVYLTVHTDIWFREINPQFNIPMVNRTAKVIKIFDWETEEGKLLLSERKKLKKWGNLDSEDFRYVLKVYFPELKYRGKMGLTVEEVLPRYYPKTKLLMFELLPSIMLKDLQKEEKDIFRIYKRDIDLDNRTDSIKKTTKNVSGRIRKKSK